MKRLMSICALTALALTGCGGKIAPDESLRPANTELQFTVEGMTETVPAALYIGDGYSIYIPEEGWRLDERETDDGVRETVWESTVNDEAELYVLHYGVYPDATLATTKSHFVQRSGYVFEDLMGGDLGDPLTGTDEGGDYLGFMAAEGRDGEAYIVAWEYPAAAAEGFGVRLPQIANTFEVMQ